MGKSCLGPELLQEGHADRSTLYKPFSKHSITANNTNLSILNLLGSSLAYTLKELVAGFGPVGKDSFWRFTARRLLLTGSVGAAPL
jgi:hypothetical protein